MELAFTYCLLCGFLFLSILERLTCVNYSFRHITFHFMTLYSHSAVHRFLVLGAIPNSATMNMSLVNLHSICMFARHIYLIQPLGHREQSGLCILWFHIQVFNQLWINIFRKKCICIEYI